jgi:hypothetical protein
MGYADILAHVPSGEAGCRRVRTSFPLISPFFQNVSLNERGFKPLFNGTDFSAWVFVIRAQLQAAAASCARTELE